MSGRLRGRVRALVVIISAGLAGACSTPPYHRPAMELPAAYSASAPWDVARPRDSADKGAWWLLFGDPVLDRLEADAMANSQTVKAAVAQLVAARAEVSVARADLFPTLGLEANGTRSRNSVDRPRLNPSVPNVSTVNNDFVTGFTASYEPDLFGRVRSEVAEAAATAEQQAADLANTRLLVASELAADYLNLRETDLEVDIVSRNLASQRKAMEYVVARHDLGVDSGLDVAQQQSLIDTTATQLDVLANQRLGYQHAIAALTGRAASDFVLPPAIVQLPVPQIPTGVPSDLLERRPDVAAAERAVEANNAALGIARAAYFPRLPLSAQYGRESTTLSTLFSAPSLIWSFGLQATETIFDAGRRDADVRAARARVDAASAQYRQTVLQAIKEVEDNLSALITLGQASDKAKAAVASTARLLELANDRYSLGVATYLDVVSAQSQLLANERQLAQVSGQRLMAAVMLIKALGGGWDGDVASDPTGKAAPAP